MILMRVGSLVVSLLASVGFSCRVPDSPASHVAGRCGSESPAAPPCSRGGCLGGAVRVSAGDDHSCALLASGTVVCWGADLNRPARVPDIDDAVEIGAPDPRRSCAVRSNGVVACWKLGARDGIVVDPFPPPAGTEAWLTFGDRLCQAHRSGRVDCFSQAAASVPDLDGVARVSGRCALLESGSVTCWYNETPDPNLVPISGVTEAVDLSVTDHTGCAAMSTGRVACWNLPVSEEFGGHLQTEQAVLVTGVTDAIRVVHGPRVFGDVRSRRRFCAVTRSGRVLCWWWSRFLTGEAEGRAQDSDLRAEAAAEFGDDVVDLSFGPAHQCIVRRDGSIACRGANGSGQLGFPPSRGQPSTAIAGITDAVEIAVGPYFGCALRRSGQLLCWGGDPAAPAPAVVAELPGLRRLSAGVGAVCGIDAGGAVCAWIGDCFSSELGLECRRKPVAAVARPRLPARPLEISVGWAACARLADGAVWCWAPGDERAVRRSWLERPVKIVVGSGVVCALFRDGSVLCDDTSSGEPRRVALPGAAKSLEAHRPPFGFCATTVTNRRFCWERFQEPEERPDRDPGAHRFGTRRVGPPAALSTFVQLARGADHSCGINRSGCVTCWGSSGYGELGHGRPNYVDDLVLVPAPIN